MMSKYFKAFLSIFFSMIGITIILLIIFVLPIILIAESCDNHNWLMLFASIVFLLLGFSIMATVADNLHKAKSLDVKDAE
jgi:cytochrome c biogenesis protein CcdA